MTSQIPANMDQVKVTKANSLIEVFIAEKTKRLSAKDQRIVLSVVSKISPDDEDFKDYRVPVAELIELTGISDKHIYQDLRSTCDRLITSAITIKEPSNPDGFLVTTWFSHAEYLPREGVVEFSVSPRLKPYLLQLKSRFTTYCLSQIRNLQSVHAIRLYELFRQFLPLHSVKSGEKKTALRDIALVDLRKHLGIRDKAYLTFSDFRRCVLEKAQKELAGKTDISFDFETIRRARKIHTIRFYVRSNAQPEPVEETAIVEEAGILDDLLIKSIKELIPDIHDFELAMIGRTYPPELVSESLMDLFGAKMSGAIRTDPKTFFMGILKNKRKEQANALPARARSTEEKLTDRSWDDGFELAPEEPQG